MGRVSEWKIPLLTRFDEQNVSDKKLLYLFLLIKFVRQNEAGGNGRSKSGGQVYSFSYGPLNLLTENE